MRSKVRLRHTHVRGLSNAIINCTAERHLPLLPEGPGEKRDWEGAGRDVSPSHLYGVLGNTRAGSCRETGSDGQLKAIAVI